MTVTSLAIGNNRGIKYFRRKTRVHNRVLWAHSVMIFFCRNVRIFYVFRLKWYCQRTYVLVYVCILKDFDKSRCLYAYHSQYIQCANTSFQGCLEKNAGSEKAAILVLFWFFTASVFAIFVICYDWGVHDDDGFCGS